MAMPRSEELCRSCRRSILMPLQHGTKSAKKNAKLCSKSYRNAQEPPSCSISLVILACSCLLHLLYLSEGSQSRIQTLSVTGAVRSAKCSWQCAQRSQQVLAVFKLHCLRLWPTNSEQAPPQKLLWINLLRATAPKQQSRAQLAMSFAGSIELFK